MEFQKVDKTNIGILSNLRIKKEKIIQFLTFKVLFKQFVQTLSPIIFQAFICHLFIQ